MIIIIKSGPFDGENVLGALFIAQLYANSLMETRNDGQMEDSVKVFFVEGGLFCLGDIDYNTEFIGHYKEIGSDLGFDNPPFAISDLIKQLFGLVKFYYIPSIQEHLHQFDSSGAKEMREKGLLYMVKKATYRDLLREIINEKNRKILVF